MVEAEAETGGWGVRHLLNTKGNDKKLVTSDCFSKAIEILTGKLPSLDSRKMSEFVFCSAQIICSFA